ncbi:MAG: hypothetical protein JW913_20305 [Chitinispirillaceae bacterium]|nr:hypothetical protein [Chitinispirillaceae bacterium]
MKPSTSSPLFVLLLPALFASSFAQETTIADTLVREKPYLIVTPSSPKAGRDSVTVQIILGTASNSCMAPTFSGLLFTIEQLLVVEPFRDITVAHYIVKVKFTQDPPPKGKVCPAVYNPVDYGPTFRLGALKAGTYRVVQDGGATGTLVTYGEFSVVESGAPIAYTIKGTVHDDPYPMKRASMWVPKAKIYLTSTAIPLTVAESSADLIVAPVFLRDSTVTDTNGNYSFKNIEAGYYTLTCTHPDYRTVSLSAFVRKDTVINFTLIPADAYATVTGQVTLMKADAAKPVPVEGCTVIVEKPQMGSIASSTSSATGIVSLRAITGADGRYTIGKIPITANGEVWDVYAFYSGRIIIKHVALYNMRTDTVDFTFSVPYENSASINIDGVVFTTAADKYVYQEKNPVRIRYSITNTTTTTKTFGPFSQGCEYDLIVTGGADKEVYRASSQPICVDLLSEIVVKPGETVAHDFPAWYISNVKQIAAAEAIVAPRSVTLKFSARLQGANYDNTPVGVPVTIELEPPVGAVKAARVAGRAAVSYNARRERLTLNLDKAQTVTVAVYTLEGSVVPASTTAKRLTAGMHTLSLQNIPTSKGLYIVGVRGADFEKRFSALRAGR